jgi:hypothetical protein
MRVAIVSDIHGNLTVFEAVLTFGNLRRTSSFTESISRYGTSPVEIVDRIRSLGWLGLLAIRTKCLQYLRLSRILQTNRPNSNRSELRG